MTLSEDEVDFRIFRVMSKKLKTQLGDKALDWKNMILDATYQYCTDTVQITFKIYNEMQEKILHDPVNEKELIASKDFIAAAPAKVEQLTEDLKEVYRHYIMLEEFSYMYKEVDIESFWYMKVWPLKIQACLTDGKNMVQDKNDLFSAKLEAEKEGFSKQIVQYQQTFEKIKDFSSLDQINDFINVSYELRKNLDKAHDIVKQFHDRETTFGLPETPYPDLDDIDKNFKPFHDLITMAHEVKQLLREWTEERLMTRNTDQIFSSISQWQSSCFSLYKKLNEDYPETAEVAQDLRGQIEAFSKNLPLIKSFTSEAILEEDWKEIQQLVSTVVTGPFERDEIKVQQFIDLDLYQFTEEIEEIAMRAEKKWSLAQKLKQMKEEMKNYQLQQADYKGITFLIRGFDEVNAKLDDQIVGTQAMLGSSFMKGRLKSETKVWEGKLNHMSELMEQILKVQRTWMYLEPIFSSGDIMNTMPLEGKMFNQVDALWKSTMKGIEEEPCIMDLAEKETIMGQFVKANEDLDKIQKSLSDYLE